MVSLQGKWSCICGTFNILACLRWSLSFQLSFINLELKSLALTKSMAFKEDISARELALLGHGFGQSTHGWALSWDHKVPSRASVHQDNSANSQKDDYLELVSFLLWCYWSSLQILKATAATSFVEFLKDNNKDVGGDCLLLTPSWRHFEINLATTSKYWKTRRRNSLS